MVGRWVALFNLTHGATFNKEKSLSHEDERILYLYRMKTAWRWEKAIKLLNNLNFKFYVCFDPY